MRAAIGSLWWAAALAFAAACGGSVAHTETAKPERGATATAGQAGAAAAGSTSVPESAGAGPGAAAAMPAAGAATVPGSAASAGTGAAAQAPAGWSAGGSAYGANGVRSWMTPTHVLVVPSARATSAASALPGAAVAASASGAAAPPERVDGGEISRAALLAVLSNGIGRFLQKVRAEAHLVGGRFVGWRLLSLFENEPSIRVGGLQPGDTVMRVNGQSIERPEQFKNVWDSMATESELVLLVQRAGKRSEVRYRIVDAR